VVNSGGIRGLDPPPPEINPFLSCFKDKNFVENMYTPPKKNPVLNRNWFPKIPENLNEF